MMRSKASTPTLQTLLQNFFLQRLIQQKKVSGETVNAYRDTFKIYLKYLDCTYGLSATKVNMEHLDRDYVIGFCIYLENVRHNKAITINNRLAALHSFMQYVAEMTPEYSAIVQRSLIIPSQKHEVATMDFITKAEFDVMLSMCDTNTLIGTRDKLMFLIMYNTGVRVSELLSLKCSDIKNAHIPNRVCLKICGKGRKERILPIWKSTATYLNNFVKTLNINGDEKVFKGKNGEDLTRSGVRFRIVKLVKMASESSPTLLEKNISAHTFRHSVAMNMLASGVDISTIAIWLGHSSIDTTHKYMVADLEMKRKAMEKVGDAVDSTCNYKPSPDILRFLEAL